MVLQLPLRTQRPALVLVFLVTRCHADFALEDRFQLLGVFHTQSSYRSLPIIVALGDLCAHVLVPELAQLAHRVVLARAEERVARVLAQVVPSQLVGLKISI